MRLKPANFSKTVDAKQWNKIRNQENNYPNLKTVKQFVLEAEKNVSRNFSDLKELSQSRQNTRKSELEINLEWFLTWRIKFVVYRNCLWCDGVRIFELKLLKEREYFLSAEIWLGPESNVNELFKCRMSGTVKINKDFEKLADYDFEIDYRNDKILVRK